MAERAPFPEKAERLIGELRAQVWMVEDFAHKALQIPDDADPTQWLDAIWDETFQALPESVRGSYEAHEAIHDEIDGLENELEDIDENDPAWSAAYARLEQARGRLDVVGGSMKYPELLHALKLLSYMLAKKRRKVLKSSTGPKELSRVFYQDTGYSLDPDKILQILKPADDPYSVVIINRQDPPESQVSGLQYRNTPYMTVEASSLDAPRLMMTMRHEQMHNVTDGILPIGDPTDLLNNDLRFARERLAQGVDASFLPQVFNTDRYIHKLHGEIVAAIERAVADDFGRMPELTPRERIVRSLIQPFLGPEEEMDRYKYSFGTAGNYMTAFIARLRHELNDENPPPALRDQLLKLEADMKDRFLEMGRHVEKAFHALDALPVESKEAARNELHNLMCVLTPLKYRHLATYVKVVGKKLGTHP